jgi:hypothetical protein
VRYSRSDFPSKSVSRRQKAQPGFAAFNGDHRAASQALFVLSQDQKDVFANVCRAHVVQPQLNDSEFEI